MIKCNNCFMSKKVTSRKGRAMIVCSTKNKQEVPSYRVPDWCPFGYNKLSDLICAFSIPMKIETVYDIMIFNYKNAWRWKKKVKMPRW